MSNRRVDKELQTFRVFEKNLQEEITVTNDFDLPLSILVALIDGGWNEEATRSALDALRIADLVTATAPDEISIALPNTGMEAAQVVERRLRAAVPEARVGIAQYHTGDTVPDLLESARTSAARA